MGTATGLVRGGLQTNSSVSFSFSYDFLIPKQEQVDRCFLVSWDIHWTFLECSLHILSYAIWLTHRCNHWCVYISASVYDSKKRLKKGSWQNISFHLFSSCGQKDLIRSDWRSDHQDFVLTFLSGLQYALEIIKPNIHPHQETCMGMTFLLWLLLSVHLMAVLCICHADSGALGDHSGQCGDLLHCDARLQRHLHHL